MKRYLKVIFFLLMFLPLSVLALDEDSTIYNINVLNGYNNGSEDYTLDTSVSSTLNVTTKGMANISINSQDEEDYPLEVTVTDSTGEEIALKAVNESGKGYGQEQCFEGTGHTCFLFYNKGEEIFKFEFANGIIVNVPVTVVDFKLDSDIYPTIAVGEEITLKSYFNDQVATAVDYYENSDEESGIIEFNYNNGETTLKGLKTGKVQICAFDVTNNVLYYFYVTVVEKTIPISSFSFKEESYSMKVGNEQFLYRMLEPEDHTMSSKITYTSSDSSVAYVDEMSYVHALKAGVTTITGTTVNGLSDTITITVVENNQPIDYFDYGFYNVETEQYEKINTNGTDKEYKFSEKIYMNINQRYDNYSFELHDDSRVSFFIYAYGKNREYPVSVEYSNENIVEYDPSGIENEYIDIAYLVAKGVGTTTVTFVFEDDYKISIDVVVVSLEVKPDKEEIHVGDTFKLVPITDNYMEGVTEEFMFEDLYGNCEESELYTSTSEDLTEFTAVKPGKVMLFFGNNYMIFAQVEVTILDKEIPITSIEKALDEVEIIEGNEYDLSKEVTINPSNTTMDKTLTYTSSNENIVTIDENGIVKTISPGEAYITIKSINNVEVSIKVIVKANEVTSIILNKSSIYLTGLNAQLYVTNWTPNDAELNQADITWTSDDESIAVVNSDGTIYAVGNGTTIIRAHYGNIEAPCTVTVSTQTSSLGTIIDSNNKEVNKKTAYTDTKEAVTVKLSDSVAEIKALSKEFAITYTSSNEEIATINDQGEIEYKKPGTVTITAKYGRYTTTATITVKESNVFTIEYTDDEIVVENTNGKVELVIDDITEKTESEVVIKVDDKEQVINLYDIYYIIGDNSTFENPVFYVKVPITININDYENIYAAYVKDGEIVEKLDCKIEGNYFVFKTTHFSDYAIIGTPKEEKEDTEDTKNADVIEVKNTVDEEIPNTSIDNVNWIIINLISIIGLISLFTLRKSKNLSIR